MATDRDDDFLQRWSRRKHAARRGEALPEPPPAAPEVAAPPAPAAPPREASTVARELPPVESLKGLESEYREFLRPDVDSATRSAALRKLFGDPHFNQMDGLDVYIDDYTKADPIPAAMLRALNQARSLGLFEEAKEGETEPPTAEATPAATPPATAALEPAAADDAPSVPLDETTKTPGA